MLWNAIYSIISSYIQEKLWFIYRIRRTREVTFLAGALNVCQNRGTSSKSDLSSQRDYCCFHPLFSPCLGFLCCALDGVRGNME